MKYYIVDENDNILDGSNSEVEAKLKKVEISRREKIEVFIQKEQP